MKLSICSLCLLLTFLSYGQAKQSTDANSFIIFLDKKADTLLQKNKVPGMAIAVLEKGEVIYQNGFGHADVEHQIGINSKTGFNIGSISKLFTAWGILKLVNNGKIDLDAPVERYLTRWKIPPSQFDHQQITIRALLSHTAGISVHGYPGFPPTMPLPSLKASLNGENGPVRANEPVEVLLAPQTKFQYSGGGYSILQLVIEEVTSTSFEKYMEKELFKTLGMKNTSFIIDKNILKNSAKPYDENGKETYIERFTAKAAAGLHTTLDDLVIFAKASFQDNKVLPKRTIDSMRKPVLITKSKRQAYGLGYSIYFFGPLSISGHAGSNTGWEAGFMMDFETKSGLIILTNGSNGEKVAIHLLRKWVKHKMQSTKKSEEK